MVDPPSLTKHLGHGCDRKTCGYIGITYYHAGARGYVSKGAVFVHCGLCFFGVTLNQPAKGSFPFLLLLASSFFIFSGGLQSFATMLPFA